MVTRVDSREVDVRSRGITEVPRPASAAPVSGGICTSLEESPPRHKPRHITSHGTEQNRISASQHDTSHKSARRCEADWEIEEMDVRNSMDVDAKRKRATSVMTAQPRLRACMEVIMKKSQAPG